MQGFETGLITVGTALLYITSFFGLFTALLSFISFFEHKEKLKNPDPPKQFPSVTIAVPAYNEEETIAATIESLLKLDYPRKKLSIIVVDDGSKDKTYEIAKQFEAQGVQVFTKENTGKGDSLNFALAHANTVLFGALDADSFVEPDCLKKMIGYFENPNVMAVTPSLKILKPQTFLQRIQAIEFLVGVYLRKVFSYFGSIHVTPGPFTIYRKKFFDQYGGYDVNNLTEDIEIALRIQSNNYEIENTIDGVVWTVGLTKFKALMHQRRRWYLGFLNNVLHYKHLFARKYGNLGMFILPAAFVSVGLVMLLLGYLIVKTAVDGYDFINNLIAINFDILPLLKIKLDLFFLNMDPLFILALISLGTGLVVLYLAKQHSQEQSNVKFSYVLYLLFYWVIFAYWWALAGYAKATKKKIAWGKKNI